MHPESWESSLSAVQLTSREEAASLGGDGTGLRELPVWEAYTRDITRHL